MMPMLTTFAHDDDQIFLPRPPPSAQIPRAGLHGPPARKPAQQARYVWRQGGAKSIDPVYGSFAEKLDLVGGSFFLVGRVRQASPHLPSAGPDGDLPPRPVSSRNNPNGLALHRGSATG
jgi:hypothetical protein